ncbi:hypothetical protein QJV03_12755 [Listeria swaminathanii]|uniref:Uncharacterized protein n=1 Tax=Listeria swaminathanii TaxID=2713501 RepID=A0ABU2IFZ7_9LIST|nr:hypothetical protein [Listeria swaminathanii]MDT0018052.1 hypothetical protein [Listeria swaminathanii]MDT0022447.1 hypothetical protein [Listeria swaminathanii]MDT0033411.1 hypothetical protein [Listeria swaminathanii]MDT0052637.1 hypothetical protein [Listeria swaminathanii]MDT0055402.1 hypothetical protein [Listeria swaminathanii]
MAISIQKQETIVMFFLSFLTSSQKIYIYLLAFFKNNSKISYRIEFYLDESFIFTNVIFMGIRPYHGYNDFWCIHLPIEWQLVRHLFRHQNHYLFSFISLAV